MEKIEINEGTLQRLETIFVGKKVRIKSFRGKMVLDNNVMGICKAFYVTDGGKSMDVELASGSRYGFIPKSITSSMMECDVRAFSTNYRTIELV